MNELLTQGQKVLAAQPFSQLLGAELIEFSAELVEMIIPITQQSKQQNGYVHGGVIGYLADNALTFAGGAILGAAVVTGEYKINYLKTAVGVKLLARASVVHAGRNQAVCRCDVFSVGADGAESLCATAQGTIVRKNES
jgi:uncharacterized protein (TIGR00369 family)